MKEITIISGKGGTVKRALHYLLQTFFRKTIVCADCDVDAADMHIIITYCFRKTHIYKRQLSGNA